MSSFEFYINGSFNLGLFAPVAMTTCSRDRIITSDLEAGV